MKLLVFLPEEVYMESLLIKKGATQGGGISLFLDGLNLSVMIEKMWV